MKSKIIITAMALIMMMTQSFAIVPGNNPNSKVIHLNAEAFKKKVFNYDASRNWKYEGSKPAILDFYAPWCGPCKLMSPILDDLSKEYDGKVIVYKVDIQSEQQLAQFFGIQSIPTFFLIPVNEQPRMMQGAVSKETMKQAINEVLLHKK